MGDSCQDIRQRAAHLFNQACRLKSRKIIPVESSPRNILVDPSDINHSTDSIDDKTLDEKYASSLFQKTLGSVGVMDFNHIQELSEKQPLSKKRLAPVKLLNSLLGLSLPAKCVPEMNLWEPVFTELQSSTKIQRISGLQDGESSQEEIKSVNEHDDWLRGADLAFSLAEKLDSEWYCYLQHIQKNLLGISESDTCLQEPLDAFKLPKLLLRLSQALPKVSIYDVFYAEIDETEPKISGMLRQFRDDFEQLTSHEIRSKFLSTLKAAHGSQDQKYRRFNIGLSEILKNMSTEVLQVEHHDSGSVYPIDVQSIIPHHSTNDDVVMSFSGQGGPGLHHIAHSCAALYSDNSEQSVLQLFFADTEHNQETGTVQSYFDGNLLAKATPGASKRYAIVASQDESAMTFFEPTLKLKADATWPESTTIEENTLVVESL